MIIQVRAFLSSMRNRKLAFSLCENFMQISSNSTTTATVKSSFTESLSTHPNSRPISLRFCKILNRCCQHDFSADFLFSPFPFCFIRVYFPPSAAHSIGSAHNFFTRFAVLSLFHNSATCSAHGSCEFSCCTTSERHTRNIECVFTFWSTFFFAASSKRCSSTRYDDNGECLSVELK